MFIHLRTPMCFFFAAKLYLHWGIMACWCTVSSETWPKWQVNSPNFSTHWMGLREHLQETMVLSVLPSKIRMSCQLSLKRIHYLFDIAYPVISRWYAASPEQRSRHWRWWKTSTNWNTTGVPLQKEHLFQPNSEVSDVSWRVPDDLALLWRTRCGAANLKMLAVQIAMKYHEIKKNLSKKWFFFNKKLIWANLHKVGLEPRNSPNWKCFVCVSWPEEGTTEVHREALRMLGSHQAIQ